MMDNAIRWYLPPPRGVHHLALSSDYPYSASIWPHPRDIIERDFRGASELERRKIVREGVAQLYGSDLD